MKFELNGEMFESETPMKLSALLERFELIRRRVAVAINAEVVPRSRFDDVDVNDGDRIEVIHAVGGG